MIDSKPPEQSVSQVRPWVRYFARLFDVLLFSFGTGILLAIFYPDAFALNDTGLGVIILLVYTLAEAVMLSTWGTTPGKALLKTEVKNHSGSNLTYARALTRSVKVLLLGLGLGLPVITLITMLLSYNQLEKHGITEWDKAGNFVVIHQKVGVVRWSIFILLAILFIGLAIYGLTVPVEPTVGYLPSNFTSPIPPK